MIKLAVFDFDGTFTNGDVLNPKIYAQDVFSLKTLSSYKLKVIIMTGSNGEKIPQLIKNRVNDLYVNCDNKLEILKSYNFKPEEIAYIGDDLNDLECLKYVKHSFCPKDAHPEIKKVCNVLNYKGGKGAIREFVNIITSHLGDITAVIPVRSGSSRCYNKNTRPFGNSNLLAIRIKELKKVKGIKEIIVSSNDDEMLQIAKNEGAIAHRRDEKYCTTQCSGSDMYCAVVEPVKTDLVLYTHCVSPFISSKTYENIINEFRNNLDIDSIMTGHELKEYLWKDNKPLNYEYDNAPPSQNINGYYIPTFGCALVSRNFVLENRNLIGKSPLFYKVDQLEAVDIDTPFDFLTAELLYKQKFDSTNALNYSLNLKPQKMFLDCTIRDGGYLNNWNFTDEEVLKCYQAVTDSGMDYFEIGFRSNKDLLKGKGTWCYSKEEDINRVIGEYKGCKIAVMVKLGTVTLEDFIEKKESKVDLVRVLIPHNNKDRESIIDEELIREAYILCDGLLKLGYKVCVNLACFDMVTNRELELVINTLGSLKIECFYMADTYGNMNNENIVEQIRRLEKYKVRIGMHAHNNMGDALSKSLRAYQENSVNFIDSCIGGLGRGSGNLWGEILFMRLNKNFIPLMEYSCNYLNNKEKLLYSLTGHLNIHPDFVNDLVKLDYSIRELIRICYKIKDYCEKVNKKNYIKNIINLINE